MKLISTFLIFFCVYFNSSESAKILAVFPAPSYSHFIIGDVLTKELVKRGHEITMLSTFKPKNQIANYTSIEITGIKEFIQEVVKTFNLFDSHESNRYLMAIEGADFGYDLTKLFFESENVQKFLNSKEKYDLIIMEHFFGEAIYGLCYLFKAPCISVVAMGSMSWSNRLTGNIGLASYATDMHTDYSPKMSFFERLNNLLLVTFQDLLFHLYSAPKQNNLLRKYIPNSPHLYDLIYNVSMVFLNSHPALSAPLPLTPNMKELGGIHIEGLKDVKLPEDVQKFLDDNKEVIYFALGSNAQSKDMPKEIFKEILKGLKKWNKPILWKYEDDLPEKIENVKVSKWFPQTAVLAHKNVVAFITHCGRLSSLESLYFGVPMIGIPLFAEQAFNAAQMEYFGFAIKLNFKTLKAEQLYNALVEITENSKYKKEAEMRSKVIKKKNALDEAVYWIEHVLEFNGAFYLKNSGVDLPWYQFWMIDVIGFLIISFLTINITLIYLILRCCCAKSKSKSANEMDVKNKKKN